MEKERARVAVARFPERYLVHLGIVLGGLGACIRAVAVAEEVLDLEDSLVAELPWKVVGPVVSERLSVQ